MPKCINVSPFLDKESSAVDKLKELLTQKSQKLKDLHLIYLYYEYSSMSYIYILNNGALFHPEFQKCVSKGYLNSFLMYIFHALKKVL